MSVVVVGDSIIKRVDRVICRADRLNRTVFCLPGARVRHVVDRVDRLLGGAGDDPAVMVHIGTNDKVRGRWKDLKNDFRELGSKLKKRSSKVVFSEILPVPRDRQKRIREFNLWLREWCREQGFGFVSHDSSNWSRKELKNKKGKKPLWYSTEVAKIVNNRLTASMNIFVQSLQKERDLRRKH
uniref:SGNH hydrolase-type esterase domain-containing protein n=1 Tax=Leptobrachium leishanense TaxID=445787 RepID=A0A8C5Q0H1_9ANUR